LDSFFWIGDYIKFNALKAKKDKGKKSETSASEKISHNALILTAPGYVIEPISGLLVGARDLSATNTYDISCRGLTETWRFDRESLKGLARLLWEKIVTKEWKVVEAGISSNELFPYAGDNGRQLSLLPAVFIDIIGQDN
jgi:hypothetical protein